MLEEDSDQVAPGLRLSGRGRVLARAHDGWVCACWDRCCCLLCQRDTATRLLQVCAFPVVDVCWHAPMMDGSVPVGTVVAVSYARGRQQRACSRSVPFFPVLDV